MYLDPGPFRGRCFSHLVGIVTLAAILSGCRSLPQGTPVGPTFRGQARPPALTPTDTPPALPTDQPPSESVAEVATAATAIPTVAPGAVPEPSYIGLTATGGQLGLTYQLTDLRVGGHAGFTRLVWEVDRSGSAPRFRVVERSAADQPENARLSGQAWIEVTLHDTQALAMAGRLERDTPESALVQRVRLLPARDDSVLVFAVELARPARFEVVALEEDGPGRIVLDVYHD